MDIAFVEVFLGVEGHIIIFRKDVRQVIVNAAPRELDDGFFLRPKAGEGDLRVRSRCHRSKFFGGEDMTGERLAVTSDALNIDADRTRGNDTSNGGTAVGKIEVDN